MTFVRLGSLAMQLWLPWASSASDEAGIRKIARLKRFFSTRVTTKVRSDAVQSDVLGHGLHQKEPGLPIKEGFGSFQTQNLSCVMQPFRHPQGISLIEVLIALVIIAVSMIALARMQGISIVQPAAAAGIAEASSVANRFATQCKEFEGEQTKGRETVVWLDNRYLVEWSAIQHDNPNRQEITVQVSWKDLDGLPRTSKLSSLIYCGHRDATKLALRRMRQELPEGYSNAE